MISEFAPKKGRMLEIGSAFGVFANQAKRSGYVVDSIEICVFGPNKRGHNFRGLGDQIMHDGLTSIPFKGVAMYSAWDNNRPPLGTWWGDWQTLSEGIGGGLAI